MPSGAYDRGFKWLAEMDREIEYRAYKEGKSSGQIARDLMVLFPGNEFSKNKIIGRLHTLKRRREVRADYQPAAPKVHLKAIHLRFRKWAEQPVSHPFVRALFRGMNEQQVTGIMMEERAGINRGTLTAWRNHSPKITDLEACFNVLGWTMMPHERTGRSGKDEE